MGEFTVGRHGRKFGVASVMEAVGGLHFPASKERLLRECGDRDIEVRPGARRKLREMLLRCGACEDFNSVEDLISQLEHEMVV